MSGPEYAVASRRVFDGVNLRTDTAVVIGGERIVALVPLADLPKTLPTHDLPDGAWLAPGFIDIQVNGGGDVLFNDDPSPDTIGRSSPHTAASVPRRYCQR